MSIHAVEVSRCDLKKVIFGIDTTQINVIDIASSMEKIDQRERVVVGELMFEFFCLCLQC